MHLHTVQTERPVSALDVIFSRRSVREYTGQRLDGSTVRSLLDAAVQAPTAVHLEPWVFVVVQEPGRLRRISDLAKSLWASEPGHERDLAAMGESVASRFAEEMASPGFNIFYDAGTLIVICGRPLGRFVVADCWLAAENLMLAACAMGLGSCCVGSAVSALNMPAMKAELGIPDDVTVVAPIIVGVPRAEEVEPSTRKDPQVLAWR